MFWQDVFIVSVGICLLVGGFGLRVWVERKRFYRRGPGGLQHFSRYSKAVLISMGEGFLMFVSIPVMILGMLILFLWSIYLIDRGKYKIKDSDQTEKSQADPKAHFLVPAEKGLSEKQICPIQKIHSLCT
ncbi:hypothetical protein LV84_01739 [Algoriphagus ratkowskyi]|uniref:Uncharacterized protein n=1 Tax=Algoriphagus ratkowskyi TaxID=57028 RepID=A0A2W7RC29_9BACT|nr:hypothetical protein [Algoriphagus ratkowskyi]PZX57611.1 hypothetical protein LV84_01739 [Algoriphagus ratkowskyi]TXD78885.1 hypothetical protein ESW18_05030 [Algoriphagus ratkowskyi]